MDATDTGKGPAKLLSGQEAEQNQQVPVPADKNEGTIPQKPLPFGQDNSPS